MCAVIESTMNAQKDALLTHFWRQKKALQSNDF